MMPAQPKPAFKSSGNLDTPDTLDTPYPRLNEIGQGSGDEPPDDLDPDYAEAIEAWAALDRYRQFLDIHPPRSGAAGEAYQAGVKARAAGLLIPIAPPAYRTEDNWELGEAWRMGWSHEDAAHQADLGRAVSGSE
jgi:hypothetical protein